MKKSRFSEEQIIGMIKEQESGIATAEAQIAHRRERQAEPEAGV